MIGTRKITLLIVVLAFLLPALFLPAHPARAEIVYEYDFEAGWDYWSADNGVWEVGEPTAGPSSAHSLPNCAATILDGNYPRYTDSRLISPAIDLPNIVTNQEIVLRFYQWFSYHNEPNTTDDNGQVQVQFYENDVWSEWETIESVKFSSGAWSVPQCDLTAYAGKNVRIGFFHVDNHSSYGGQSTGWYIDDVLIEKRFVCLFDTESIEDFESGWGCWWADNGVWEVGAPTSGPGSSYSGLYCAGTVLSGNYPRYTDSRLISPPIDLDIDCTTIYVRWWQWFSYYNEPNTTDDRGQVQIQTHEVDHWSDWQTLGDVVFSSGDWSPGQHDLTAYAGKRVRIGFFHADNHSSYGGQSTGWYIDDFEITEITGNIRPYPPSSPSPSDNEDNVPVDTDLCWVGGDPDPEDTVTYDLYAGTSSPMPLIASGLTETCFDPGTLEECTTYYWKIVAEDNHGARTEGPEWSFTTICTDPVVPDIKANGLDDPQFVAPSESVDISISLDPGDMAGVWADWWGILLSSHGTFPLFGFQAPLFELPDTSLFSSPWPVGWYIFLFGLDDVPDGAFELDWYDYVVVVSQPTGAPLENIPNFDDIVKEKMIELIGE